MDEPLRVTVDGECVSGKCIIINKNVRHVFSCDNRVQLSVLIEPSSGFAKELLKKIEGNYLVCDSEIECIQQKAAALLNGSNVTDAAMLAGFNTPSHFAATVKKWMGMPVSASIKDSEFLKVFI